MTTYMLHVILSFLRLDDHREFEATWATSEFKASLDYTVRPFKIKPFSNARDLKFWPVYFRPPRKVHKGVVYIQLLIQMLMCICVSSVCTTEKQTALQRYYSLLISMLNTFSLYYLTPFYQQIHF